MIDPQIAYLTHAHISQAADVQPDSPMYDVRAGAWDGEAALLVASGVLAMADESAVDRVQQRLPGRYVGRAVAGVLLAISIIALVALLAGSDRAGQAADGPAADGPAAAVWPASTPAEQGMDVARLDEMLTFIEEHDLEIRSIIILRHGRTVFEHYNRRQYANSSENIYSVTKSVISLLVGIALDQGDIPSLDTPLRELLSHHDFSSADPGVADLTLEHLLTMTAGLDWPEHDVPYSDPANITRQMWNSPDPVQFVLERPLIHKPGQVWAYNSGASLLLGAIVEEATGRDLVDYANEALFQPIGIDHIAWSKGFGGYYDTGGGLRLKPQEMARLGYLMLRKGQWQGRQVVPATWVSRSTAAYIHPNDLYDYGYQWWVQADGQGFEAQGLHGQQVSVFPTADMVVVITAHLEEGTLFHVGGFVHDFILPAYSDLPPRPPVEEYQDHGVTFVYPAYFSLSEQPFPGQDAVTDEAGIVQITSARGFLETFSLLWSETTGDQDEQALLDQYLAVVAESEESLVPGDSGLGEKDGRPMPYRFSKLTAGEIELLVISGLWTCPDSGQLFAATYLSAAAPAAEELLATFETFVAGVSCP